MLRLFVTAVVVGFLVSAVCVALGATLPVRIGAVVIAGLAVASGRIYLTRRGGQ